MPFFCSNLFKLCFFFCQIQVGVATSFGNQAMQGMQYVHVKTCMPIEEHARSILTPYAFNELQQEIVLSQQYAITEMADGSHLVRHYKKMDRDCLVIWIQENEQIHCSCKEFEHSGILCRHSIRVLVSKDFFQVPDKYFPLRWRLESTINEQNALGSTYECVQAFHSIAATLLTESLMSKERFVYVHKELLGLVDQVKQMAPTSTVAFNSANNDRET